MSERNLKGSSPHHRLEIADAARFLRLPGGKLGSAFGRVMVSGERVATMRAVAT